MRKPDDKRVDYYQHKLEEIRFFLSFMRNYEGNWRDAETKNDNRGTEKALQKYSFALSAFLNAAYSASEFMDKIAPESAAKREWLANKERGNIVRRFLTALRNDLTHNCMPAFTKVVEIEATVGLRQSPVAPQYFIPEESGPWQETGDPGIGLDTTTVSFETAKLHSRLVEGHHERGSITFVCNEYNVMLHDLLMYGLGEGHIPA